MSTSPAHVINIKLLKEVQTHMESLYRQHGTHKPYFSTTESLSNTIANSISNSVASTSSRISKILGSICQKIPLVKVYNHLDLRH